MTETIFAIVAQSLTKLTEKNQNYIWSEAQLKSWEELKRRLITAPILRYPDLDAKFILDTDANDSSIGAALS